LHFLVAGLALFLLFEFVGSDDATYDDKVIIVDRDALLTFAQFRARAFEPGKAAAFLDGLAPAELDRLIDDYVREEALYRQALALGVDQNDYVIKRRMIQSIEFITNGFITASVKPSDDEIEAYFEAHRDDYYISPHVTFTHVYFGTANRGVKEAAMLAAAKLAELNSEQVPFTGAPAHGDRFPYFLNYVEREPEFVAAHFGQEMTALLMDLTPDDRQWRGPFESTYGYHVVLLTKKVEGRYPDLAEVYLSVRSDAEQEAIDTTQEEAVRAIVGTYEVRRAL
jgi:parvulin-like peptidyl-prolyl isomerase